MTPQSPAADPSRTEIPQAPTAFAPITEGPGAVIGRYKILEQVGEGGFGVVYVAEQKEPVKRRVALKIIKLGMDTRQVVARFESERQALALMDHPNIAKVLDAGTTDNGRPYFVMELIKGIPITQYCDQEKRGTRERLDLFIQVCQAVQHAHQKGIIHRDIKPSNILVTLHDGVPMPKVIDFGIAKATAGQELTDKTVFTQFQQFMGTPAYMSPEQAEMSGLDIDTRSDIYSLGVLLYELLVGNTPFDPKELLQAGVDEMRRTIRDKEPARPSTRLNSLPGEELTTTANRRGTDAPKLLRLVRGDLDWIVMKCLEKDRTRRYETANGLAADIHRHLNHEPVVARPPSRVYKLQTAWRRNRILFTAGVAVAVALITGIGVSTWQTRVAIRERRVAEQARRVAEQEQLRTETERARAERNLYATDMLLAERASREGNLGLTAELLEKHRSSRGREDLRGWEWRYLWGLCQGDELFTVGRHPNRVHGVTFSPDGAQLASASSGLRGDVKLWDPAARRVLALPAAQDAVGSVVWSPDGKLLAYGTLHHGVKVWSVGLGRDVASIPAHQTLLLAFGLTFHPREHLLAVGSQEGTVTLWDTQANTPRATLEKYGGGVSCCVFSPDGNTLAVSSGEETIMLWDVNTCAQIASLTNKEVLTLAYAPDGRSLLAGGWDGNIRVWDLASLSQSRVLTNHSAPVFALAFSPNGKMLASGGADYTIRMWDPANWQQLAVLRGHRDEVSALSFSPDGARLLSGAKDGEVKIWQAKFHPKPPSELPVPAGCRVTAAAPDARTVLFIATNNMMSLWDAATAQHIRSLRISNDCANVSAAALAPGGTCAVYGTTDGSLHLWNTDTGRQIAQSRLLSGPSTRLQFSRDGKALAVLGAKPELLVVDTVSLAPVRKLRLRGADEVTDLVFSPDDRWVAATTFYGDIELWDMRSTENILLPAGCDHPSLGILPDEKTLVTAAWDNRLKLWDVAAQKEKASLGRTRNAFFSVAVSPDGRRIAAGASDGTIGLWDASNGLEIGALRGPSLKVSFLGFSPDGNALLSGYSTGVIPGYADGGYRIWRAPSWEEIAAAEAKGKAQ